MARLPRLALDQQLHHLVHHAAAGVSLQLVDADRLDFMAALVAVSREAGVAIHAYALLPHRLQLLLTPQSGSALAPMMQRLGRRYAGALNKRHGRSGPLWEGRYRASVLQASEYLVDAMRHVELAAVNAGLAEKPEDWAASSAGHHFGMRFDPLIVEHPDFWSLGNTPFERELSYRRLCETPFPASISAQIEDATNKGWALGDATFIEDLSSQQARRLLPLRRGRPRRL